MVKNSGGTLSGNTRKLKGKMNLTVSDQVRTFELGQKVIVNQRSTTRGQPHMRYNGRHGVIIRKQGKCYVVKIKDGNSTKELVASSIHLKTV
jgi:large subunit ribosomal protein L21e